MSDTKTSQRSAETGQVRVSSSGRQSSSVTVRTSPETRRILSRLASEGVTKSDAVRRGLQLVEQERWLDQARADMAANQDENLNDEPDAW